jgi:hypothetical protein
MNKLKAYKLNKAFTDGVDIRLDGADVVCKVRLPSQYNRGYTQALYSGIGFEFSPDGLVKPSGSVMDTRYAQEDAFVEHCLLSIDGESVPDDFAKDYPTALIELMEKSTQLANEIEEKVNATVKKSQPILSGSETGQERKSSIPNSKNEVA